MAKKKSDPTPESGAERFVCRNCAGGDCRVRATFPPIESDGDRININQVECVTCGEVQLRRTETKE